MKVLILILMLFNRSHAFEVKVEYGTDSSGAIIRTTAITCEDSESNLCLIECGKRTCQLNEPTCMNCAGSSSEILQIIFAKISKFYQVAPQSNLSKKTLFQLFRDQKLVLLDSQSPFNFYTNITENQSLSEFNKLCPFQPRQSWVVLLLDSYGFPARPLALICEGEDFKQSFFELEELPMTPVIKYNLN